MHQKITITLPEELITALREQIGRGHISQFIEHAIKPYFAEKELEAAYQAMSQDSEREAEAEVWSETTLRDLKHEAR